MSLLRKEITNSGVQGITPFLCVVRIRPQSYWPSIVVKEKEADVLYYENEESIYPQQLPISSLRFVQVLARYCWRLRILCYLVSELCFV